MSRSLRTAPRDRQAERRAPSLDRLRVRVHRPRPGFVHPAGPRDVLRVFEALGAWAWYGLRVVELRQTEDPDVYGRMRDISKKLTPEERAALARYFEGTL